MISQGSAAASVALTGPTWRRAYRLLGTFPRALLLPLVVTQLPATILWAVAYFVIHWRLFPEIDFRTMPQLGTDPQNYLMALFAVNAVFWMFTLIGVAGTIVAARSAAEGESISLSAALDPGFTRLGGLLALGAAILGITLASAFGVIVLLYVLWRMGLAIHIYMLDGSGPYGALGRSWLLLRGRMLRFAGMLLTLAPIALIVTAIGILVGGLAMLPLTVFEPARVIDLVAMSVGASVIGAFAVPVSAYVAVATTLFYLNMRAELNA